MLLHPMPCWMLAEWHPAQDYGPPILWDFEVLGPYPHFGMYEIIQPFYERIKGEVIPMPLNFATLEMMVPIILKHKHDSAEKRLALLKQEKEGREKAIEDRIADNLQDSVPLAMDAISFSGQTNKHSFVQQKIDKLEAILGRNLRLKKGLQTA